MKAYLAPHGPKSLGTESKRPERLLSSMFMTTFKSCISCSSDVHKFIIRRLMGLTPWIIPFWCMKARPCATVAVNLLIPGKQVMRLMHLEELSCIFKILLEGCTSIQVTISPFGSYND
jgi:hypothetical protein